MSPPRTHGCTAEIAFEGFGFRAKVDPEGISTADQDHLRLYAYTVAGVLCAMTRPRGDGRDVYERLDEELRPPG